VLPLSAAADRFSPLNARKITENHGNRIARDAREGIRKYREKLTSPFGQPDDHP
jgi:hypothetical protein